MGQGPWQKQMAYPHGRVEKSLVQGLLTREWLREMDERRCSTLGLATGGSCFHPGASRSQGRGSSQNPGAIGELGVTFTRGSSHCQPAFRQRGIQENKHSDLPRVESGSMGTNEGCPFSTYTAQLDSRRVDKWS